MPSIADARTVLVIGATAGLGRALAKAIRDLPSKPHVIAAGRRRERLEEFTKEERIIPEQLDVSLPREELISSVNTVLKKYSDIDAVVFSAGIQREIYFTKPDSINLDAIQAEMYTNYLSIVTQISKCFLPHFFQLEKQGRPTFIIPLTSGLATVPKSNIPVYSSSKAALRSLCISLTKQLEKTNVHLIEIAPPLVESELHDFEGTTEALSKIWMPQVEWTKQTMEGLLNTNGSGVVAVGWAKQVYSKFEDGKEAHMMG